MPYFGIAHLRDDATGLGKSQQYLSFLSSQYQTVLVSAKTTMAAHPISHGPMGSMELVGDTHTMGRVNRKEILGFQVFRLEMSFNR